MIVFLKINKGQKVSLSRYVVSALLTTALSSALAQPAAPSLDADFDTQTFEALPSGFKPVADFNRDGVITAQDFLAPQVPTFIKKPADLFDTKLISKNLDFPVFIVDSKFSETVFGTKSKPQTQTRQLVQNYFDGVKNSPAQESVLVAEFRKGLKKKFPEQSKLFDQMNDKNLILQAQTSYAILARTEGNPVDSFAGRSYAVRDKAGAISGCFVTAANPESLTWESIQTTAYRYAGQTLSVPYSIYSRFHEIMGEEIEHCAQFKLREPLMNELYQPKTNEEYYRTVFATFELGGNIAGVKTAQNLIPDAQKGIEYNRYSNALNQITNLHVLTRFLAVGNNDGVSGSLPYTYGLSQKFYSETGNIYRPEQLADASLSLAKKIMAPYEIDTLEKQKAFEQYGYMTFRDLSARLTELLQEGNLSLREQRSAKSELDALNVLGIIPGDCSHLKSWKTYQVDGKKPAPPTPGFSAS